MIQDNPIIKKRFEEKMKRLDKTSLSILISWAINNAVQTLSPTDKKDWQKLVKERYQWFIDEYRNWMLENMPVESDGPGKLTQEQIKSQSEGGKWQEHYDQASEVDEINLELNSTNQNGELL